MKPREGSFTALSELDVGQLRPVFAFETEKVTSRDRKHGARLRLERFYDGGRWRYSHFAGLAVFRANELEPPGPVTPE